MKKFLPIIIFLVGLLVLGGVFLLVRSKKPADLGSDEEANLVEVPLERRPVATLTPSEDGHWLKLKIEKLEIDAKSLDYELLYRFPDTDTGEEKTAGVPGTVMLADIKDIERNLLMGSESSGKFRYDEGVEGGTLTLRFRNDKGKLLAKFSTDFRLQLGEEKLTSVDGKFTYTLEKMDKKVFYVTMQTFGLPERPGFEPAKGPYGVFSSKESGNQGQVDGADYYLWDSGEWKKLDGGKSEKLGIFVSAS